MKLRLRKAPGLMVMVVNGCYPHGRIRTERTLRRAAKKADILLCQEMKYIDAKKVLDPAVWDVIQYRADVGERGCVVAVRKENVRVLGHELVLGTEPHGVEMNTRHWLVVDVLIGTKPYTLIAGHLPPARYGFLWQPMIERLREITSTCRNPVITGCDWNEDGQTVREATGMRWTGVGILGLAYTPGVRMTRATAHRVGSDHLSPRSKLLL